MHRTYKEKKRKYADLTFELKEIDQLATAKMYSLVIYVLVHDKVIIHTKELNLTVTIISEAQKADMLVTTRIVRIPEQHIRCPQVRTFLQTGQDALDKSPAS